MKTDALTSRYRFIAELGHGGMADVYLATAQGVAGFNKLVVVKRLRDMFALDPAFVSMFLDEARLAARLNHPNVVHTYDVGEEQGVYFLSMEYIEGQSLHGVHQKLGRSSLPLPLRLRILADVLAGLHHAHELCDYDGQPLGVVHRDVSPHNILVAYDGQVKVVDFGIAKALDSSSQTSTGVIKGKVAYMAPEQAWGDKSIDRRADLFAVGIMLWEALTGERLYKGMNNNAILASLLRQDGTFPAPSSINPALDPALDAICARALAWPKAERYASAREMQGAIERYLLDHGGPVASDEIGAFLREPFASDRARVRSLIEEAVRQNRSLSSLPTLSSPEASGGSRSGAASSSGQRQSMSQPAAAIDLPADAGDTSATGRSLSSSVTNGALPSRGSFGLLALGLLAVAVFLGMRLLPGPAAPPAPSSSATALVPVVPSGTSVRVQLRTAPPGAQLSWDGAPLGVAPFENALPRDGQKHRIRAVAPGFEPSELEILLDRDVFLEISLESISPPGSSAAPSSAPLRRRSPPVPAATLPAAPPPQPSPAAAPSPTAPTRTTPSFENPFLAMPTLPRLSALTAGMMALLLSRAQAQTPPAAPAPSVPASSPAPAASSSPAASPTLEEAKQRYTRALELFQEGSFEASLLEFKRSYELSRSFKLLYNMALVSKQMNDQARAIRYLEQYLREGGAEILPERTAEVRKELDRLYSRVGRVTVSVNLAGAEILIDDVPAGQAPLSEPLLLNAGRRKISAQSAGKIPSSRFVEVTGGDVLTLSLSISDSPAPATTTIVREVQRDVPTWPFWLSTGAFAAGGLLTGILTLRATSDARDRREQYGISPDDLRDVQAHARNLALTTDVLLGASLLSAGAGIYFSLRTTGREPKKLSVHPHPSGVSFQGRF